MNATNALIKADAWNGLIREVMRARVTAGVGCEAKQTHSADGGHEPVPQVGGNWLSAPDEGQIVHEPVPSSCAWP